MKIITLPDSEASLIQKAKQQNRLAQKTLFDQFAPKMLSICRQYIKDFHYAEDVMITGFTKAFKSIETFDSERSFGAWLRKIMVNESISFLRKQTFQWTDTTEDLPLTDEHFTEYDSESSDIQYYIDQLPTGYKAVFLLYAIEGFKHHEIAELLNISEGASKSQLHKAREFLKNKLQNSNNLSYGK